MINKFLISLVAVNFFLPNVIYCQSNDSGKIADPLMNINGLSGMFGEIRTDHFHSGIDFRTNNGSGQQVFSSFDGYVSRIKVSTVGFGKTLYIDHPNGYTSVYAHLERYSPKIDSLVKNYQYDQKSYEVEIFPEKYQIPVRKGELIAYSGNTGSSAGPHLHYELRYSDTQIPFNPLSNLIYINDCTPPKINSVYIYKMDSLNQLKNYISSTCKNYSPFKIADDTLIESGRVAIGIDATDIVDSMSSIFGVSSASLSVNNKLIYRIDLNEFSFAETRYVNSTIDYRAKLEDKKEIIRLCSDPNNLFSGLKNVIGNGVVELIKDSLYRFDITVCDFNKNKSNITFWLKGDKPADTPKNGAKTVDRVLDYRKEQIIDNKQFKLSIPKNTLYNYAPFTFKLISNEQSSYSALFRLGYKTVPLNSKVELRITATKVPNRLKDKAVIVSINGKITSYPTTWENGYLKAAIPSFGDYFVLIDTIPPLIRPKNFIPGKDMSKLEVMKLYVKDDISGIKTINGYIDGKWALFEYDPKENEVKYTFDAQKLIKNSNHQLEIKIKDERGNENNYNCSFFW